MHSVKDTAKGRPKDAAEAYQRAFPGAFLGMVYRDLLTKHIDDVDLWCQVLADERADIKPEERRRVRVPWLIEQYKRMKKSMRELETPADRLTDYAGDRGQPVDFAAALAPLTDEKRAEMLAIYEEERQKVLKQRGLA